MPLDLSRERLVSSIEPDMTLEDLLLRASRPEGLQIFWAKKDNRLLRVCKTLSNRNILQKECLDKGLTTFYINPHWDGELTN